MATYLSPGVYTTEKDISEIVANVATATGAIVGVSEKGQVGKPKLITNTQQFIQEFGIPDPTKSYFHYSALSFLRRSNALYCVRIHNGAEYGGLGIFDNSNPISFTDASNEYSEATAVDGSLFQIFGKDPGVWNKDISITISDIYSNTQVWDPSVGVGDFVDTTFTIEEEQQYTFTINVFYKNELVETWNVSRQKKVDGFGRQLYIEDKINDYSNYIVVKNNDNITNTTLPQGWVEDTNGVVEPEALGDGDNGGTVGASDYINGWGLFENPDDVDIRLLIEGGSGIAAVQIEMDRIASARADCFAILDMPYSKRLDVQDMVEYRKDDLNINSNYSALYTPWARITDNYNDRIIEVPPSGLVAANYAYNDYVANVWSAPAGFTRGSLSVLGLSKTFTQGERDILYSNQINPIQMFRGEGIAIWGQKTLQAKASALSSINVRRLLITIEKSLTAALRPFLFELNDEITRYRVDSLATDYLGDLSIRGAFQTEGGDGGFRVICDSTNNTPTVIDRNELRVDVFVKPARVAEYIKLQMIITKTGASFDELISRGVQF